MKLLKITKIVPKLTAIMGTRHFIYLIDFVHGKCVGVRISKS